jgi:hypothetical protein
MPPKTTVKNLSEFLDEVEKLFDDIIGKWGDLLFKKKFRQPLAEAWSELKITLLNLKQEIKNPSYELQNKLKEVGLSEKQLSAKLLGLNDVWERFREYGTVKLLKKLLDFINDVLGSLGAAVPGIEALEELKKLIEKWLDDEDDS